MNSGRAEIKKLKKKKISKKKNNRSTKSFSFNKHILLPIFIVGFLYAVWYYRYALYYVAFQQIEKKDGIKVSSITNQFRIYDVLQHHKGGVYGIDISHYQGEIDWNEVQKVQDSFPISFVFIRATAGTVKVDRRYTDNWLNSKKKGFIRGAYHYYRPDENSILQANNFINNVKLEKGDLPPVLDIEDVPRLQSVDNLKKGLRRWLNRVERHYGVKPIIYSGESFYNTHLYKDFSGYTFWIANYNFYVENIDEDWCFWQFTDKGSVQGINEFVDVNVYNGDKKKLLQLVKK